MAQADPTLADQKWAAVFFIAVRRVARLTLVLFGKRKDHVKPLRG